VLFEIPIFHIAPELLRRFGAGTLQQIASVAYVIRVVGYTLIPQGHIAYVLLLEPLHGVTYACSKTSSVDFAAQLMPPGYEASGQGLLSLFQGLGSVVGLFLGGLMEDTFGPRIMYRSFAGVVLVGSVVFGVASLRRPPEDTAQHVIVPQTDDEHGELSLTMRRHGAKRKDSSLVIPDDDVEMSTL
jgi:MFS family permease